MTEDIEHLKMEIANSLDIVVATNLHGVTSQNTVMFVLIIARSTDFTVVLQTYTRV
jgi:hypothetical protein